MKKKSLLLGLTAVIVISAMAVGGTLAYFTSTAKADNTFTVGSVAIKLFEHDVAKTTDSKWVTKPYRGKETEVNAIIYEGVYPGAVLPKDPTIRNTGNNPAYVRIKVTISNASAWLASIDSSNSSTESKINKLEKIFGDLNLEDWTRTAAYMVNNTIIYVYNYNSILMPASATNPDAKTGELFKSVTIPTAFNNAEMSAIGGERYQFTMDIKAEAIQEEGFNGDSSAAFAELNGQLNPSLPPA